MEVTDLPAVGPNVDYEKILPIHQKRIITFVNHFITNTVSFLNHFAQSCESHFMEFEYKMQRIEASLLILESQLSSISNLSGKDSDKPGDVSDCVYLQDVNIIKGEDVETNEPEMPDTVSGPKANEDSRFVKFFKMVQFGVPVAAVKNKMAVEGLDPDILDKPNDVIPGYDAQGPDSITENSS